MKKLSVFLAALLYTLAAGADTKISALPAGTTLAGTEALPAVQSAATVKTTPAAISTYVGTALNLVSGVYNPTCTAQLNVSSTSCISGAQYLRVGSTVVVGFGLNVTPTATGNTRVVVTIPIPSAFTANDNAFGACGTNTTETRPAQITADPTLDGFFFVISASTTGGSTWNCTATYRMLP